MTAVELENRMDSMSLTPSQYMDSIVPVQRDPRWEFPSVSSNTSLTELNKLPLPDFVLEILKKGQCAQIMRKGIRFYICLSYSS